MMLAGERRAFHSHDTEREVCINCHEAIAFGIVIVNEWTHWHGDRYCHDRAGYCASPLREAQPPFHPARAVL